MNDDNEFAEAFARYLSKKLGEAMALLLPTTTTSSETGNETPFTTPSSNAGGDDVSS